MRLIGVVIGGCLLATAAVADEVKYVKKYGDWSAVVATDAMTDARVCVALYEKAKGIAYTSKDAVELNWSKRGGVSAFRYRFGKAKASEFEFTTERDNDRIVVPVFVSEALDMPNLLVQGQTVLRTPIDINISLKGLKAARADLATRCSWGVLPDMVSAPDWAAWQATPQ